MVACRLPMQPTWTFTWYNSVENVSRQVSMCYSCAMMSPKDTSLEEEDEADVGWAERDGVGWEGGVESYCFNLNCSSLCFMVAASMAHMKVKGSDAGEGTKKWHKILVIAEGKMSLSRDAKSWKTSIKDKIKWEGKSMVRCWRRDNKKRAWDSVMEL